MIRVTIDGLFKLIDRVALLDGASLELPPGGLTVVAGPSGAGKTTLARVIAGLDAADRGEIYFDGRVMQGIPVGGRKVGLLFQDDALWPHLSVAENVGYGLKVRGVGRRERNRRVLEALDQARIGSLGDRSPEMLSGLHRRRAALARALVLEPDVLILDEPFGPLETRVRGEFRDEVRRVHAESGTTTLLLTHEPAEALPIADQLAVMDLGRIIQAGPPNELLNRPIDPFVAQFLGPANLLPGQVEGADPRGVTVVRTAIGRLIGQAADGPLAAGEAVTVAVRPESLMFGPNVPHDANRFLATLERTVLLGGVRQVHLIGPGDQPLLALAFQNQVDGLRDGASLTVAVAPDRVIVLPSRHRSGPEG